jgi:hypothetical protein
MGQARADRPGAGSRIGDPARREVIAQAIDRPRDALARGFLGDAHRGADLAVGVSMEVAEDHPGAVARAELLDRLIQHRQQRRVFVAIVGQRDRLGRIRFRSRRTAVAVILPQAHAPGVGRGVARGAVQPHRQRRIAVDARRLLDQQHEDRLRHVLRPGGVAVQHAPGGAVDEADVAADQLVHRLAVAMLAPGAQELCVFGGCGQDSHSTGQCTPARLPDEKRSCEHEKTRSAGARAG